jgi:maleate cis-trans isomerase
MYGWRGRVGLVSPARADTSVYEFYLAAPEGLVAVSTSLKVQRLTEDQLDNVLHSYQGAAQELDYEEVDVMILGGSPPVALKGYGFDQELVDRCQAVTRAQVVALIRCEMEALQAVGARRIAIGAPYTATLTAKFADYFRQAGFEVVETRCLGIERNIDLALLPEHASYRLSKELFRSAPRVDTIHLTCPRWPTLVNLSMLEQDLGVPVTSSGQSIIYSALRRLGIRDSIGGFGSLLEKLATEPPLATTAQRRASA